MTAIPQHWDADKLIVHFQEVGQTGQISSVLTDELIGAVVQSALHETQGHYFELNESVTVYYRETLTVEFRAGGPRLHIRDFGITVSSVKYEGKNTVYLKVLSNYLENIFRYSIIQNMQYCIE